MKQSPLKEEAKIEVVSQAANLGDAKVPANIIGKTKIKLPGIIKKDL